MNWMVLLGLFGASLWGADQQAPAGPETPSGPTVPSGPSNPSGPPAVEGPTGPQSGYVGPTGKIK